ncbi:MAG: hypothetical protein OEW25_00055 [Nitrospira sp.]|nr:hypothetical protein [Nitrospira sp.]MDH5251690.1 hypothetical protein [Nitrospira sp.]
MNCGDTLMSGQYHIAHAIVDISKRMARSLSKPRTRGCIAPLADKAKGLTFKVLDQAIADAIATTGRDLEREFDKARPKDSRS